MAKERVRREKWIVYGEYGGYFTNLKDAIQCAKEASMTPEYRYSASVVNNDDGCYYIDYEHGKCVRDGWSKRGRIKHMLGYIEQHIENAKCGYDEVEDISFIIRYKSGEVLYVYGYDIPDRFCRDVSKIDYIVFNDSEDSYDSNGKSWLDDFIINGEYTNESLDAWNEYVSQMLYKDKRKEHPEP